MYPLLEAKSEKLLDAARSHAERFLANFWVMSADPVDTEVLSGLARRVGAACKKTIPTLDELKAAGLDPESVSPSDLADMKLDGAEDVQDALAALVAKEAGKLISIMDDENVMAQIGQVGDEPDPTQIEEAVSYNGFTGHLTLFASGEGKKDAGPIMFDPKSRIGDAVSVFKGLARELERLEKQGYTDVEIQVNPKQTR